MTEDSSAIYARALALLARREHSRQELRQKLLSSFPNQQVLINQVLAKLEQEAYQSDKRFAEAYVRARRIRGIGSQRLRQELRIRGIEDHLLENTLSSNSDEENLQHILHVWQKKFASLPTDAKEKLRQVRFLLYRGFRQQDVERLFLYLKEHSQEH